MDNSQMMDSLDIDLLQENGYLEADLRRKYGAQCVYQGYKLNEGGQIRCQTHGSIREIEEYEASKRRKKTIIKLATIMFIAVISYFI